MSELEEIIDTLWLYSTHENHPWTADEVYAALRDGGDLVIDGLVWALQQTDVDLKLLALQLLQEYYADAQRALPAVRILISDDEDRLVRVSAINTLHLMQDGGEELIPILTPRLDSEDGFERVVSAANLLRTSRSEDAYFVLRREAAQEGSPIAEIARWYLSEAV